MSYRSSRFPMNLMLATLAVAGLVAGMTPAVMADPSPFVVHTPGDHPPAAPLEKLSSAKEYYSRAYKESNENKDYAAAVRDYTEAIRLNPKYGEAFGNRGAARFNLQDYNGALSDYNEALKYFPGNKAVLDLKVQAEQAQKASANAAVQAESQAQAQARARQALNSAILGGGDFADPSTMIMQNAERRGLIPAGSGDMSDPATIIMNNAKRRGLIPKDTPNP